MAGSGREDEAASIRRTKFSAPLPGKRFWEAGRLFERRNGGSECALSISGPGGFAGAHHHEPPVARRAARRSTN